MHDWKAPLHSGDPFDWMGYADWLMEENRPNWQYVRAIHDSLVAFTERQADLRRIFLVRYRPPGEQGRRQWLLSDLKAKASPRGFCGWGIWVRPEGARRFYRLSENVAKIEEAACTPWDVPWLVEKAPDVAWAFFRRITGDALAWEWIKKIA